jgi:hypothetical protein
LIPYFNLKHELFFFQKHKMTEISKAIQGPMEQIFNLTSTEREIVRSDPDFKTSEKV